MTELPIRFQTEMRVRYDEADPMGFVHHANYFRYFEFCRTELLRTTGTTYREVEATGCFVVVVRADVKFRSPARYDDLLTICLSIPRIGRAKVEHCYEIRRGDELICEANLTLAVLDGEGRVQNIPTWMQAGPHEPISLPSTDEGRSFSA